MPRPLLPIVTHLTVEQIQAHYRSCRDGLEKTHWHILWLLTRTRPPAPPRWLHGRHDSRIGPAHLQAGAGTSGLLGAPPPGYQAMIDRAAGGQGGGAKMLALSGRVFEWWRRLGSGGDRRRTLRSYLGWLRPVVRLNLEAGRNGPGKWTAGVRRKILLIEPSL